MQIHWDYNALDVHAPFHADASFERNLFGAMGSGKSYGICAEAIIWCLEQPGIEGIVTRATIPELRDSTEQVFFDLLPHELYTAGTVQRSAGHYERFVFPNGSTVLFRAIDDWKKYKSYNLGFIAWDEADEFDEETYLMMKARLRQTDPTKEAKRLGAKRITRTGTWLASNPEGHNWIWKRFVNSTPTPEELADGMTRNYFTSTSFDNPYLPPHYYSNLLTMPPAYIKRYVLCQFDDFAGQIYEGWNDSYIVPPFPRDPLTGLPQYPEGSLHWMGMDPGTRDPTAGVWAVIERTPRFKMTVVAEYQEHSLAASVHAGAWRKIEALHRLRPQKRIGDPNAIGVRDRGTNVRLDDQYRRLGFNFEMGPSRYDDRIPALADLIENRQFFVTSDCPLTYEGIRDARWKDLTPGQRKSGEDAPAKPEKKDRHLCDAVEYLAGKRKAPIAMHAVAPDGVPDWQFEVQQQINRKLRGLARGPAPRPFGPLSAA